MTGEQNRLYLNDGSGSFTDVTATHLPADGHCTLSLALGDVDGDDDLDIVVARDEFGIRRVQQDIDNVDFSSNPPVIHSTYADAYELSANKEYASAGVAAGTAEERVRRLSAISL